ncbi:extracellular solute-binding protein [Chachezhania sediminis]|uniref:extracellular solute-binding protein n=1 Tax=Chachezhania sediminis TaxID=2599291 RepID=UPI00131ECD53
MRLGAALLATVMLAAPLPAPLSAQTTASDGTPVDGELIVSHGYSFFGDLKYPADYTHLDYVNPDAPKGGEIVLSRVGTFDSMNPYSRKGRGAALSTIMYETLLDGTLDEYNENYGLLAESVEYPADKSWVIFHMRPEARFSDGTPVTAHDVLFSHNLLLEQGLKSYAEAVKRLIPEAEVIDDHTIKFYFADGVSRRSLIEQVGGVPVWSKKWYEETGARLDEPRLETSPGSGPYVVDTVDVNRRVIFKRNPDYWGKDLPITQGRSNFDRIRVEYFGDDTAAMEAFKAGIVTFRPEGDAKLWATSYDFPKIQKGIVKKEELDDGTPPTPTGFVFNMGRPIMQDKRVREALALGYNFEWTNESLQYGLFSQRSSFTQNSALEAKGPPEGAELELLKSLGDLVPPEMLTEPARMPHTSNGERLTDRRNLRAAMKYLDEAGWPVGKDGKRHNAAGEPLRVTFLFNTANETELGPIVESYVANLRSMGIDVNLEKVDPAQYTLRERDRDYDMIFDSYREFLGAGTGLPQQYGSEQASFSLFNPAGLASPLVDATIEAALRSTTLEEEQAALMALDRSLRYEFVMVPVWYKDKIWVAYYDEFEHPEVLPPFDIGFLDFWWVDADKAAKLKSEGAIR